MLILTRKLGESIKIGDQIEVKIVAIEGEQIKLGIEAPRAIDIHRKEVYEAIQKENSQAATNALSTDLLRAMQAVKKGGSANRTAENEAKKLK
ncbi:carbon storage regulator CsrA [Sporolactobacillus spathodeae]|uniref:Translational regulator CsrA n=1 Tax=Sporolactobacillus spathodeae TaxID=1465502 RepID=A0ABS2Q6H0_9BACL|nr:carbon storage regulator CsrA [Sporolactobacillus spathodeae]MBM7657256.1 carbon storage regulator [Sporolactobacillus spathodeae]